MTISRSFVCEITDTAHSFVRILTAATEHITKAVFIQTIVK